jgi:hypothetical protein
MSFQKIKNNFKSFVRAAGKKTTSASTSILEDFPKVKASTNPLFYIGGRLTITASLNREFLLASILRKSLVELYLH